MWSCSPARQAISDTCGHFPLGAVPLIALGALAMVGAVWLGLAVGSLLPSPLTAPMLAVIGFVGLAVSPMIVAQDESRDRVPSCSSRTCRVRATAGTGPGALGSGEPVPGAMVRRNSRDRACPFAASRPRTRVAALLPVVLGAAIAVPAMPRTLSVAWIDDRATEVICTATRAQLCLPRLHSYAFGLLRGRPRQALSIIATKLPPAPARVLVLSVDRGRRRCARRTHWRWRLVRR